MGTKKIEMAIPVSMQTIEIINITGFKNSNIEDIKEFFDISDYDISQDGYNQAINKIKDLTASRKMDTDTKIRFQKSFPAILTSITIHFGLAVSLKNFVSEYMALLHLMSPDERNKNPLIGNETGYLYKLLEDSGSYPPAFNLEKGTFKFPNQWYSAFCIISNNIETLESVKRFK